MLTPAPHLMDREPWIANAAAWEGKGVAEDRELMDDIAHRPSMRAALVQLDHAWPDTSTLDAVGLGVDADDRQFDRDVQCLIDLGLIQYELVLRVEPHSVYRDAAITQHGREIVRALRIA